MRVCLFSGKEVAFVSEEENLVTELLEVLKNFNVHCLMLHVTFSVSHLSTNNEIHTCQHNNVVNLASAQPDPKSPNQNQTNQKKGLVICGK